MAVVVAQVLLDQMQRVIMVETAVMVPHHQFLARPSLTLAVVGAARLLALLVVAVERAAAGVALLAAAMELPERQIEAVAEAEVVKLD